MADARSRARSGRAARRLGPAATHEHAGARAEGEHQCPGSDVQQGAAGRRWRSAGVARRRLHDCRRRRASRRIVSTLTSTRAVRTPSPLSPVLPTPPDPAAEPAPEESSSRVSPVIPSPNGAALRSPCVIGADGSVPGWAPRRTVSSGISYSLPLGEPGSMKTPSWARATSTLKVRATITTRAVLIPTLPHFRSVSRPCQPRLSASRRSGTSQIRIPYQRLQRRVARVECERPLIEPHAPLAGPPSASSGRRAVPRSRSGPGRGAWPRASVATAAGPLSKRASAADFT